MKPNVKPETDDAAINRILTAEEELIPSSGFLAATMERVREEAAMPKPIPFPWLCVRCPELHWAFLFSAGADLKWCARA